MLSSDHLNSLLRDISAKLSGKSGECNSNTNSTSSQNNSGITLSPSAALVIAGLLTNILEVTSVLVDKNQLVQIVLSGSLKQKTEMDIMIEQLGSKPFDEVMKSVIKRFS